MEHNLVKIVFVKSCFEQLAKIYITQKLKIHESLLYVY